MQNLQFLGSPLLQRGSTLLFPRKYWIRLYFYHKAMSQCPQEIGQRGARIILSAINLPDYPPGRAVLFSVQHLPKRSKTKCLKPESQCSFRNRKTTDLIFYWMFNVHLHKNVNNDFQQMHFLVYLLCIGPIEQSMELLQKENKGKKMNTWESYYIQYFTYHNNIIEEQTYANSNPLFQLV